LGLHAQSGSFALCPPCPPIAPRWVCSCCDIYIYIYMDIHTYITARHIYNISWMSSMHGLHTSMSLVALASVAVVRCTVDFVCAHLSLVGLPLLDVPWGSSLLCVRSHSLPYFVRFARRLSRHSCRRRCRSRGAAGVGSFSRLPPVPPWCAWSSLHCLAVRRFFISCCSVIGYWGWCY
jgi:hypothetical protein